MSDEIIDGIAEEGRKTSVKSGSMPNLIDHQLDIVLF